MTTMPAMSLPTLGDGLAAEVSGVELALLPRAVLTRSGRKTDEPDLVGKGARVGHRESIVGLERERHRNDRLLAAGEALLVDGRLRAPDRHDPDVPHQHTHLLGQTWDIGEDRVDVDVVPRLDAPRQAGHRVDIDCDLALGRAQVGWPDEQVRREQGSR